MTEELFRTLKKGDNVFHATSGEQAIFDGLWGWADMALVVTERGHIQLWSRADLADRIGAIS